MPAKRAVTAPIPVEHIARPAGPDCVLFATAPAPDTCQSEPIMRTNYTIGAVLVLLGLFALTYQGFTYTSRDTVVDIGPIHASAERQHTVPVPRILGIGALVCGVAVLVAGARSRAS